MHGTVPIPDSDSLVAEPPPVMHWVLPLIFVGGVAWAWRLWNLASQGAQVPLGAWYLPALAILCGPLWFFQGRRRVVMDRASVWEYRGKTLLRRYPIGEITAVRPEINGVKLVFANRGAITIPNVWPGGGQIVHHLQSVVDSRAGGVPPADDWLPLNYLVFPPRCVSCGSREVVGHRIFAGTHYHIPGLSVTRGYQIPVPACVRCSQRRKVVGFVTAVVLISAGIGLIVAAVFASERFPGFRIGPADSFGSFFLIAFAMLFVVMHVATNSAPRWLDRRLLGMAALRLGKDQTTVRLWFRDRQQELEVHTLTAENSVRTMSSTSEFLRAHGREQLRG